MPTSVEKILLLWKIYQTSPDCEEEFVCIFKKKNLMDTFVTFKMVLLI